MLSRIKFEIAPLVNEMLDQLPKKVWTSTSTTFLDPAMAGGQFVREVERRLLAAGHDKDNVASRVFGCEQYEHQVQYAVNKYKLTGSYQVVNFLEQDFENMKFDVVLMNPPYTNGQVMLYTKFFDKALNIGETVVSVMPLDLQSKHDKLKFHNERVLKHHEFISNNVSEYFNVAYDNLHYIIAKKSIKNEVVDLKDPLDDIPLLFNNRPRLVPIKGDTDIAIGEEVPNGVNVIFKVHKNDTVIYKKVDPYKINKSSKKSTAPYLVIVNHTPSKGKFNCVVLPNTGLCWSMWTFAFEVNSQEEGNKLKDWLISPIMINEINNMLVARNNQHTISKAMIERLPTYE
jgi:predicted RNA methylase